MSNFEPEPARPTTTARERTTEATEQALRAVQRAVSDAENLMHGAVTDLSTLEADRLVSMDEHESENFLTSKPVLRILCVIVIVLGVAGILILHGVTPNLATVWELSFSVAIGIAARMLVETADVSEIG